MCDDELLSGDKALAEIILLNAENRKLRVRLEYLEKNGSERASRMVFDLNNEVRLLREKIETQRAEIVRLTPPLVVRSFAAERGDRKKKPVDPRRYGPQDIPKGLLKKSKKK